ncbi:cation:dicarboxylate symporter family transporter [Streptomyces diastatochromogenes]|uniref:cation:dicarboxylate symporter family transporter n=1 Tax=Streptomyces diastatochromogenes TaxID=42236 RepID=UPI00367DA4E2
MAIVIGIVLGWRWPDLATSMEPIGTTFITPMKMPTGLVAINVFRLGDGVHADPSVLRTSGDASQYISQGEHQHWWEFLTGMVPNSFFGPFVEGDILQVIFLAVLFGIALKAVGRTGELVIAGVHRLTDVVFKVLSYVMKVAPLGAFGATSYAIGKFGLSTLTSFGSLILLFYVTSVLFVVVVLTGMQEPVRERRRRDRTGCRTLIPDVHVRGKAGSAGLDGLGNGTGGRDPPVGGRGGRAGGVGGRAGARGRVCGQVGETQPTRAPESV